MIRIRRILFSLLLIPAGAMAQDDQGDVPPPEVALSERHFPTQAPAPPVPTPQAPAPAAPGKAPMQGVAPVSPGSSVMTATPAPTSHTVSIPAQTVMIQQEAPKVLLVTTAPTQLPLQAIRPEPAQSPQVQQAPSVQAVAVVREKGRFCRALGALGTKMSGFGQPSVTMGVANVTTAPVVQSVQVPVPIARPVVIQQAPTYVQQAPTPSPQGSAGTMMSVSPARRWGWWR
jgi:hypothetical protein